MACIMVFDNKPQKFRNDRQRVLYVASFLSEIALLWWQPNLVAYPEPPIWSDWAEFITELDKLFCEPNLTQSSECALRALTMQENHHINKYMIKFSEHAAYIGWNDAALYGKFYWGLAECLKDQLLNMDHPQTLDQLKIDALKCDNHYWECQHEKGPTLLTSHSRPSATTSTSTASQPARPSMNPHPAQGNGLNQV